MADIREQLRESANDFEPPSIQSQRNIRAIDRMHEAAATIDALVEALSWALPYARNQSTDEEGLAQADAALSSIGGEAE